MAAGKLCVRQGRGLRPSPWVGMEQQIITANEENSEGLKHEGKRKHHLQIWAGI